MDFNMGLWSHMYVLISKGGFHSQKFQRRLREWTWGKNITLVLKRRLCGIGINVCDLAADLDNP